MWQIRQVQDIDLSTLMDELRLQLEEVKLRIEKKAFHQLFILEKDDEIIGLSLSWLNSFHPEAKYVRVYTTAACTETNWPTALYEQLFKDTYPQKQLIFSCWDEKKDAISFMEKQGFKLFRKTYMPDLEVRALLQQMPTVPTFKQYESLNNVLQNNEKKQVFLTQLKENYENTHLHNPVQTYTWQQWGEILLDDEPDLEYSYVVFIGAQVVAYILLHKLGNYYEVGWIGFQGNTDDEWKLTALFKTQMELLQREGIKKVSIEIDTTDNSAFSLFSFLDFKQFPSWNSYSRQIDRRNVNDQSSDI